ncbi:MAG: pectin acetylesterase-family hydrolase [Pseudomonadota bacterium]
MWKWIVKGLAALIIVGLIGAGTSAYWVLNGWNYKKISSIEEVRGEGWRRVELGRDLKNSDGSRFYGLARKGSSDNLMIYFQGGGLAWNATTAANPMTQMGMLKIMLSGDFTLDVSRIGFYTGEIFWLSILSQGGVFNFDHPDNLFKDWNILYIPYATGDLHLGRSTATYETKEGEAFEIHHTGALNVEAALDWAYTQFPNPEKVVVAGSSAGGAASSVWVEPIARHYAKSRIYQISDGIHIKTDVLKPAMETYWKADTSTHFGFDAGPAFMEIAYLSHLDQPLPNVVRYLHTNTTYDEIGIAYMKVLDEVDVDVNDEDAVAAYWTREMRQCVSRLASSGLPYSVYLSDQRVEHNPERTQHTFLTYDGIYDGEQGSVRFIDWLKANIEEDKPLSVGVSLLETDQVESHRTN